MKPLEGDTQKLLLAGWHNVCQGESDMWVHPKCDVLMPIEMATKILERRGTDAYGEMNGT